MNPERHKTRKRYLEPDACDEPLPRSTLYEMRKRVAAQANVTHQASNAAANQAATTSRDAAAPNERSDEGAGPADHSGTAPHCSLPSLLEDYEWSGDYLDAENDPVSADDHNEQQSSTAPHAFSCSPFHLEFVKPVGNGTSMSVGDVLVLAMDLAIKHGFTWEAIEDLLKFSNVLLGKNVLPESKFLFRKFCGASPDEMEFYFYCPVCERLLAKSGGSLSERNMVSGTCCGQQHNGRRLMANGNFFVSLPLKKQLAGLLEDSNVREQLFKSLNASQPHNNTGVSDIMGGAFYKQQRGKLNCDKQDFTVTVNTDGSPMFKSSNYSIWPVHLTLNELPPHLRWSNIICALLWYGSKHPNMTLLLQAFADKMEELSTEGISWSASGQLLHSKVYCISSVADAPARASMQNVMQYNGYYGCSWCLHPGKYVEGCVKYPVGAVFDDRTEDGMLDDMRTAATLNRTINGVKGPSPLINIAGFNIVWSFRPDYMHSVLLGVSRQLTDMWFSDTGTEYYIGAALAEVDGRLLGQRPHASFNRTPRSLKLRRYWKASEWESWLLYYCLPCLQDILPAQFLNHFALLVSAVYLLLKSHVSMEDIDRSTKEITEFVIMMECHYGAAEMTSNVHTLLHLPKSVLLHGPLWAISCYEFENNMGNLLKLVSSSNGVPFQILSRILMINNFQKLLGRASEDVRQLCLNREPRQMGTKLLGNPQAPSQDLVNYVEENVTGVEQVQEFHRLCVEGCVVHSELYKPGLKRDSTAVKVGDSYARVEHIVSVLKVDGSTEVFIVSHVYVVENLGDVGHIKRAHKSMFKRLHPVSNSIRPCIYMNINGCLIFAELCNRYGSF